MSASVCLQLLVVSLAVLAGRTAAYRGTDQPLRIDCGSSSGTTVNGLAWSSDNYYTGGQTATIPSSNSTALLSPVEMSLRYFPTNGLSCYNVPVSSGRYLIRVGFAYMNYDGLNSPPLFNVQVQGTVVETVDMASVQVRYTASAYYSDYIAYALSGQVSVCLQPQPSTTSTTSGSIFSPIINSLEVLPVDTDAYEASTLGQNVILSTYVRLNMGGPEVGPEPADPGFRIWSEDVSPTEGNYTKLTAKSVNQITDTQAAPDYLPNTIFLTARQADPATGATGFRITVVPVSKTNTWYLRFYFAELDETAKAGDRVFDILIGSGTSFKAIGDKDSGFDILANSPVYGALVVPVFFNFSSFVQNYGQDLEVGVKTVSGSKLPAIISAVELYEVIPVAPPPSSSGGLTGWQIALIVVGCVLAVALLALVVVFVRRRQLAQQGFRNVATNDATV